MSMNTPNQADIQITAQADQYTIAPGGKQEIPLLLVNNGTAPEQCRIGVEGIPLVWVFAEQQVVLLQPGAQVQVILTIQPPALPNVQIGRYILTVKAASMVDPARLAQTQVALTVAGFEVKGRVGVLLQGLQYSVVPGEQLVIDSVLINQGLTADTLRLALADLPSGWAAVPEPVIWLQPGEVKNATWIIKPPREPGSRASRYPFRLQIASQEAPDQTVSIDCTLTVAAFTAFKSTLQAAQPEQNLPRRVAVQNLSNIPVSFNVSWSSPEDVLLFEPAEPQQVNVPGGETAHVDYSVQPARRPLFGGEKNYPYAVAVRAPNQKEQSLQGSLVARALLPTWALIAGAVILALMCFCGAWSLLRSDGREALPATATLPAPTATQSQIDQRPLLVQRNWYLAAYNTTRSTPGVQKAFTLFNPDGTLVGHTGCKDLRGNYQTNFNQISITNLNLGSGACPDATLMQQEDSMIAVLRSARSYYIADTVLQLIGDAGFLSYSLFPPESPEQIQPPQAVINAVTQAQVGQVVVFDGAASTGQAPIVSWRWDFGDGARGSGMVLQHTYVRAGTFTVSLAVTDQRGQSGSTTVQIHILALPTPTATATQPPPTAMPTLPPPTATPVPPTLPPLQPTYTPVPTAEPPTATPEPPPAPVPPQARVSGPGQGYIGEPVKFDASASQPGSSPITGYSWSLGNGQDLPVSPQSSVSATYNRAGDYEVTVFVFDQNGQSSFASTRISIGARLDANVWTLSTINAAPLLPGTAITMQFRQGELSGFAGCNTYSGSYTATANDDGTYALAIGPLRTSRMNCPQDIMQQEQSYLAMLQAATTGSIQGNMITLNSPSGSLVYFLIEPR